jgi:pimeloyl-ACP methyl ester carboxylesterase
VVGIEKEAAVPLGVSIPGAIGRRPQTFRAASQPAPTRGIIGAMPPTRIVTTPDGRSLDVWLDGPADGEPFLFHHGTPGTGLSYGWHVDRLTERGLRRIAISRPGYGGSTRQEGRRVADVAADVATVLDHLGIERTWVAGWSGGGPHALATAALLPDRVLGTALIAGVAPYSAEGLDWHAGMGEENVSEFGAILEGGEALRVIVEPQAAEMAKVTPAGVAASLGDLIDEVDRGALDSPDLATYMADLLHEAFRVGYWGWFDDDIAITRPWGFDLASIPGRVHLWQGAHDRMVPYGHGQWLAAHTGGACAHLFDDQGHLSLVHDRFGDILDELLAPDS